MITSINHITLAVRNLEKSIGFYCELLGGQLEARWNQGAYLMLGDIWLCLALDKSEPANDYSHIAFNVAADSYMDTVQRLQQANVQTWKSNHSEGHSFYFLDLDKHKLELHEGNLASRLNSVDGDPYDGWVRYER